MDFFSPLGRRGWGMGEMGLGSLVARGLSRCSMDGKKLGMQFSFAVVKSSVKEYASIRS